MLRFQPPLLRDRRISAWHGERILRQPPGYLVYIVNRRTVVDQTTEEMKRYKKIRPDLAISTLRGEFVDNREWSTDPSREAVICGTVGLKGSSAISAEMALRLSKALGRTPESWLAMQYQYDLWRAKSHVDLARVGKVRLTAQ